MSLTDGAGDLVLTDRDAYQDALAAKLVDWRATFEGLNAQLTRRLNGRSRGGKPFKILAARHAQLIRCLREIREATDRSWEDWRERTDKAWEELQVATEEASAALPSRAGMDDEELDLVIPTGRMQGAYPD